MESSWIISLAPKKVRCQMGSKWQADSNLSGFQLPSLGGHNLKIKPITILLVLSLACEYVESKGLYTYIEHIIYNSFTGTLNGQNIELLKQFKQFRRFNPNLHKAPKPEDQNHSLRPYCMITCFKVTCTADDTVIPWYHCFLHWEYWSNCAL